MDSLYNLLFLYLTVPQPLVHLQHPGLQTPHMAAMSMQAAQSAGTPQSGPAGPHHAPPSSGQQTPTPSTFTMMPPSTTQQQQQQQAAALQTSYQQQAVLQHHQMIVQQQQQQQQQGAGGAQQGPQLAYATGPFQYAQVGPHHMIGYMPSSVSQGPGMVGAGGIQAGPGSVPPHMMLTPQHMGPGQQQQQQGGGGGGGGPAGAAGTPGQMMMQASQQPGQMTSTHQFVQGHAIPGMLLSTCLY